MDGGEEGPAKKIKSLQYLAFLATGIFSHASAEDLDDIRSIAYEEYKKRQDLILKITAAFVVKKLERPLNADEIALTIDPFKTVHGLKEMFITVDVKSAKSLIYVTNTRGISIGLTDTIPSHKFAAQKCDPWVPKDLILEILQKKLPQKAFEAIAFLQNKTAIELDQILKEQYGGSVKEN